MVVIQALAQDLAEDFSHPGLPHLLDSRLDIIRDAEELSLHFIMVNLQYCIAGAGIAVIQPADAPGVNKPGAADFPGESFMGMPAEDNAGVYLLGEFPQAFFRGVLPQMLVGGGSGCRVRA